MTAYPVKAAPGQGLGLGQMKAMARQAESPQVRYCALYALGESRSPQAAGLLIALLQDPDPRARRGAAHALGKLSQTSAVMPLVELLCRPGECQAVRSAAAASLGRLGDPRAVAVLSYHSQSQYAWVRGESLKALARLRSSPEMRRAGR
ncbi:MAG: HEAT repeat domain-containing protein [Desulfarculaceae bacterium]|nr:HEAT repeat domain-containing protein [Desulfarculaceae bacterium]